jgi:2'-5' RNA ligase
MSDSRWYADLVCAAEYDRFSIVAFAPPEVQEAVEALRRQLPPSGRPIMAAHVTLKGTFVEPRDLDDIAREVDRVCAAAAPFTIAAGEIHVSSGPETGGVLLAVQPSDALMALHQELVAALRDRCETIYGMEITGTFRPHLTIVQQIPVAALAGAQDLVERASPRYTFAVTEAVLVGRRGGRQWEPLRTTPIGSTSR